MDIAKTFFELYNLMLEVEERKFAKHTISAIVVGAFEELESSGTPITPESIEEALKHELRGFDLESVEKKAS